MNIDDIKTQVETLSDENYNVLLLWLSNEERQRRATATAADQAQQSLIEQLRQEGIITAPTKTAENAEDFSPWQNPNGSKSKAYIRGDRVKHSDRIWECVATGLCFDQPGETTSWEDLTDNFITGTPGEDDGVEIEE